MELIDLLCIVIVFLLTLCFGSFMNVVIYRLPNNISIVKPASHCPKCKNAIAWYDNIPVLSFVFLRGKCRHCHEKISSRYIIVELLTAILSTAVFIYFYIIKSNIPYAILSTALMIILIGIFFIDMNYYFIPDTFNLIILLLGITSLFFPLESANIIIDYKSKLISIAITITLIILAMLIEKITNKEFIGGGDLKLFGAIGIFLGWELTILGIVIASIIALIIEIPFKKFLKRGKTDDGKSLILPFGPYLVTGFTISLLFGLEILNWYINLLLF